ncbi:MAG: hypothetical protein R3305_07030, partial [Gammaproteobacteria bacterium]|nr:hypothetical protein [Gammaproteobacteria bacterium]
FAKPISLRANVTARQTDVAAEQLGGAVGTGPVPVRLVVFSKYEPGAKWRPERLSPGQTLLELLANTFAARERPDEALDILARVASRAAGFKCKRGDTSAMLTDLLSATETLDSSTRCNDEVFRGRDPRA